MQDPVDLADPAAFGAFYRRHGASVLTYFMRRTGNAEVAADLTSETFAAALASAARYRPEDGEPQAWLFGIARHKLADALRSGSVEDTARRRLRMDAIVLDDEAIERIEALASLDVSAIVLVDALDELPPEQRAAVHDRVVLERSYGDIARELSTSPLVVRKRVSRGLATLRARLGVSR
jgi:RNA polymerase sigma-70 factor (ECF subfamily)